jgi:hypothetical protein
MTGRKYNRRAIFWLVWTYVWTVVFFFYLMWTCLYAQPVSETFQKQVWPGAASISTEAWELRLPAHHCDTIFYSQSQTAEVVYLENERPTEAVTLRHVDGKWTIEARNRVRYNAQGFIVELQSWTRKGNTWIPEVWVLREIDANSREGVFEFRIWNDGQWFTTYRQANASQQGAFTHLEP